MYPNQQRRGRNGGGGNRNEPPVVAGRVPPHDLDAEAAVLSAVLLSREALDRVLEILKPEHFYSDANGRIYEASQELSLSGTPIDIVSVASYLRDRERLAQIGGPTYLAQLTDATPAVAHVAAHAQSVYEKWRLRQLIATCQRVSAEGYGDVGVVQEFIDSAEQAVYELARTAAKTTAQPLNVVLRAAFQQITAAAERGDRITGISTGFEKLDAKTAGLHAGDLTIVAARPGMGKTSFVLNLGVNVASPRTVTVPGPGEKGSGVERQEPGFGVVVFSLEMPREQLAVRLVCAEGRVDVGKVRQGYLQPEDWRRLTEAASYLSSLPVWIDDTPAIGLLELRAKVRRIQAEYNREATATAAERRIGLVVVDYLQLMKGRDGVNSREQEISEISRGLKQLAKELTVPVIALSQLNRAVETRTTKDKRPQLSDLRECVTGDTLVVLRDGRRVPIRDLVGATPDVVAVSEGRLVTAASDKVWSVGRRPIFAVHLASGRSIRATGRHRLLGADGWKRVEDLRAGDRLAIARRLPEPVGATRWPEARLALLGHLVGDGSYLTHQPMRYTTASEENSELVAEAARSEFGATVNRHAGRGSWHQLVISGNGNRWHPAGVNLWLRELGVYGQRSHEKRIPPVVFGLPNDQLAVLLRHLWATDGSISLRRAGTRGAARVFFSTNSRGLAEDVAALLLRLGIVGRLRTVHHATYRPVHTVDVSGADEQRRFLERVGAFGPRRAPAARLSEVLAAKVGNTNVDTLPREVFGRVRSVMKMRGLSQRGMAAVRGTSYGGTAHFRFAPSRAVVAEYAEILDDPELRAQAESELFWDRVVDVAPSGEEEVFDLTVPGPASWLADGVVSHNSGAIEQDADTIIFIYRDEYYNAETTSAKGIAELIVAKQRNGPTGKVLTRFTASCTRFDNLAPGDYPELDADE
jgi:replicative DNA helicase